MSISSNTASDQVSSILDGGNNYYDLKAYQYLLNFMNGTDKNSPAAYNFCYGIEQYAKVEGYPVGVKQNTRKAKSEDSEKKRRYEYSKKPVRGKVEERDWDFLKQYFQTKIDEINGVDTDPPIVVENFLKLATYLGFSEPEKKALEYLITHGCHDYLDDIAGALCSKDESVGPVIARMCQDEPHHKQYSRFVSPNGKLIQFGLMDRDPNEYFPRLSDEVGEVLAQPNLEKSDIIEAFIGTPANSDLDIEDFEYMGQDDIDLICKLIQNAVKDNTPGVNILIYGPAGGGKTELSKAISKKLGISMYSIGEDEGNTESRELTNYDEFGDATSTLKTGGRKTTNQKRLSDLVRAQSLLKDGGSAFLLFDEIEDLLLKGTDSEKAADTESKIVINRLLEKNPVPVIWNGNDPDKFHQAVRDRFIFSLYVDHPPVMVRKKIWQKQASLQGVDLSDEDISSLAREYDASPRKITLALKAAKSSGLGKKGIEMVLPASAKITLGSSVAIKDYSTTSRFYNPDFSNIQAPEQDNFSLREVLERAKNKKSLALLANGPQGSGLRSLARHVAEDLNMNISEYSMAGLITQGPMEPGPAQKIMQAFNGAADMRRVLAIHDLEVLAGAASDEKSWDRELMDVLIGAIREHQLPLILTSGEKDTKFPFKLKAVFSNQIRLNAMSVAQRSAAFETFFGQSAPSLIDRLEGIVPADFANVRKDILKMDMDQIHSGHVLKLLARQIEMRQEKQSHSMGFGIPKKGTKIDLPEIQGNMTLPESSISIGVTIPR
ncbi:MAG: AAA family ATPase [Alphaproteobacteria bacterium]